jgi:hypothetical protein
MKTNKQESSQAHVKQNAQERPQNSATSGKRASGMKIKQRVRHTTAIIGYNHNRALLAH